MNSCTHRGWIRNLSWLTALLLPCTAVAGAAEAPSLKQAAKGRFHIGVALNGRQFSGEDAAGVAVVERHFDSITAENAMKWQPIHPKPGTYDFEAADRFVRFGEQRGMFIVGHALMWHSQTPRWVFEDAAGQPVARDELLKRLREHIHTVVGRYKGRVKAWDVVNEAVKDEDGSLRLDRPWYKILGQEGILVAFQAAHEADPAAELYYNDYSLANPVKRAGVLRLVRWLRAQGARVDAVGSQEHCQLDWPKVEDVDATLRDFAEAGFKVMVTELDVSALPRPRGHRGAEISDTLRGSPELDPYREGLPPEKQAQLAQRYAELFAVFTKHQGTLTRVTFWGVSDRNSWLNNFPIRGRTDYPLLFDRNYQPKPALEAVIMKLTASVSSNH
jgi:endo-1,4-beta-xylanase